MTFRLVNSIKKPDICVRAIKACRRRRRVHLYFVGVVTKLSKTSSILLRNNLAYVSSYTSCRIGSQTKNIVTTFLPQMQQFNSGNFSGGLSGALLDCIAAGLPTVANVDLLELWIRQNMSFKCLTSHLKMMLQMH